MVGMPAHGGFKLSGAAVEDRVRVAGGGTPGDAAVAAFRRACCDSGRCLVAVTDHDVFDSGPAVAISTSEPAMLHPA